MHITATLARQAAERLADGTSTDVMTDHVIGEEWWCHCHLDDAPHHIDDCDDLT